MESLEAIRTWLSNRDQMSDNIDHYQANCIIHPSDPLLCQYNLPDLHLRRLQKPKVLTPLKRTNQQGTVELGDVLDYMSEFLLRIKQQRKELECVEHICNPSIGKQLAQFLVQESINLVASALAFDNQIVDLSQLGNLVDFIEIDHSRSQLHLHEIISQILLRLFTQTPAYIFVNAGQYKASLLSSYLVDLLHMSGAPKSHVQLFAFSEPTTGLLASSEHTRTQTNQGNLNQAQTTLYVCLNNSDIDRAVVTILETYLREPQNPRAIVLIEHSIYQLFLELWQSNYSKGIAASEDLSLLEICVDLNSIDMSVARRTRGNCINMIKFHSLEELCKLVGCLRSSNHIAHVQLWTNDTLLARQLAGFSSTVSKRSALRDQKSNYEHILTKRCSEFWLNHLPASLSGRRFQWQLIDHFRALLRQHMDLAYSEALRNNELIIDKLRRQHLALGRKCVNPRQRGKLIWHSYLSLISKYKSLKQLGLTVEEAAKRMRSFQQCLLDQANELEGESRIEHTIDSIGLAILTIEDKVCIKSKAAVVEFIYKNLLVGNAVLLVCPKNLLGARFPQHLFAEGKLPFAMVEVGPSKDEAVHAEATFHRLEQSESVESSPATSAWSTPRSSSIATPQPTLSPPRDGHSQSDVAEDSGLHASGSSAGDNSFANNESLKVHKCPRGIYAIKLSKNLASSQPISRELTSELSETLVIVLGCRRRSLWFADELGQRARAFSIGGAAPMANNDCHYDYGESEDDKNCLDESLADRDRLIGADITRYDDYDDVPPLSRPIIDEPSSDFGED